MSAWLVSITDGVLTGIGLYALVRLRMYLGPIAGRKFGIWGRRAVWVLLIAAMVGLAEIDLLWLRSWLERSDLSENRWHYEAVFAATLLLVGFALVCCRVLVRSSRQGVEPCLKRTKQPKASPKIQ